MYSFWSHTLAPIIYVEASAQCMKQWEHRRVRSNSAFNEYTRTLSFICIGSLILIKNTWLWHSARPIVTQKKNQTVSEEAREQKKKERLLKKFIQIANDIHGK